MISGIPDSTDPPWPADPNWSEGLEMPPPLWTTETVSRIWQAAEGHDHALYEIANARNADFFQLHTELATVKSHRDATVAALKAQQQDTERLEWLMHLWSHIYGSREEIDAAMKSQENQKQ